MFRIINKQTLTQDIKRLDISAPEIARKVQPGQFVSVCVEEYEERIPLAVIDADPKKGIITLIVQEVGDTTKKLGTTSINEEIYSILGPLGVPAQIDQKTKSTVVCLATGIGTAQILPICRALKNKGCKVIGIIGAKTKKKLLLEPQMRLTCTHLKIATEDGSYDRRGLATDIFKEILNEQKIASVFATGSVEMMQTVCSLTQEKHIETYVQVNPTMVDCMGMCGACRIKVDGKIVLACIEGPIFDGHTIDFEYLKARMKASEGNNQWHNQRFQLNRSNGDERVLQRFLSDILKK